jgi:hypothetical protein
MVRLAALREAVAHLQAETLFFGLDHARARISAWADDYRRIKKDCTCQRAGAR